MAKNSGKPYEEFVQRVLHEVNQIEGLTTIKVEPSRIFEGNTRDEYGNPIPHQIDVSWTFVFDGVEYSTLIQAKDWANQVPLKEMIAFHGIVNDIGNQLTEGMFVARSGFQKGATSWAKATGIKASELRQIHDSEKENRVETIITDIEGVWPSIKVTGLDLGRWLAELNSEQKHLLSEAACAIDPSHLAVEFEDGTSNGTLLDHINWDEEEDRDSFSISLRFEPALYFVFHKSLPKARLDGLTADIHLLREFAQSRIHEPLTHILRSVTGDQSYFVSLQDTGKLAVKRADNLPPPEKPRPKSTW